MEPGELLGKSESRDAPAGSDSSGAPPLGPARPSRRLIAWGAAVLVLALAIGAWQTARFARAHAAWTIEAGVLTVRDAVLGTELWSIPNPPAVFKCRTAPWSESTLLVSLQGKTPQAVDALALDRATGDTLWTVRPDLDAVHAAFGDDVLDAGNLFPNRSVAADLNGDGIEEIVFCYFHTSNYPGILVWVDDRGRRLGQYANHGQFFAFLAADIDDDGREELLACGTTNARAYEGANLVVLDEDHFRGASVDGIVHPESAEPDSALYRLVVPNFPDPYMDSVQTVRLYFAHPRVTRDADGAVRINADVIYDIHDIRTAAMLFFDEHLQLQGHVLPDGFLHHLSDIFPDSLITDTGPADPAWVDRWLSKRHRFVAGHWPPSGD